MSANKIGVFEKALIRWKFGGEMLAKMSEKNLHNSLRLCTLTQNERDRKRDE